VKWSYQLNEKQAAEYDFASVMFEEEDGIVWNPYNNK
jgi:hypothetical protein